MATSLPGTSSGLPARPAAPGELAVPISSSTAPAAAGDHHGHRIGRDRPGTKGEGISDTPRRQRPAVLQYLVRQRDLQLQGMAMQEGGGEGVDISCARYYIKPHEKCRAARYQRNRPAVEGTR